VRPRPSQPGELQRRQLVATRRFDRLEIAELWLLRRHRSPPLEIFDDMALDPIALAAKERDRFAALIRDFDIVDACPTRETALVRDSGENVALARRRQIFDRAALRDRVEIVTVARERECAVGEREYEAAMADRVTVHHVAAYRHRERSPARLDLHDRHA